MLIDCSFAHESSDDEPGEEELASLDLECFGIVAGCATHESLNGGFTFLEESAAVDSGARFGGLKVVDGILKAIHKVVDRSEVGVSLLALHDHLAGSNGSFLGGAEDEKPPPDNNLGKHGASSHAEAAGTNCCNLVSDAVEDSSKAGEDGEGEVDTEEDLVESSPESCNVSFVGTAGCRLADPELTLSDPAAGWVHSSPGEHIEGDDPWDADAAANDSSESTGLFCLVHNV